jgi:predicted transcriptional regulator
LFHELIVDKLEMSRIILLLRERPLSIGEISEVLDLSLSEVSKHLNNSASQGLVRFDKSQKSFAPA